MALFSPHGQKSQKQLEQEMHFTKIKLAIATVLISVSSFNSSAKDFLNVSYDPTRELYENLNQEFGQYWKNQPDKCSISNNRMVAQANKPVR